MFTQIINKETGIFMMPVSLSSRRVIIRQQRIYRNRLTRHGVYGKILLASLGGYHYGSVSSGITNPGYYNVNGAVSVTDDMARDVQKFTSGSPNEIIIC